MLSDITTDVSLARRIRGRAVPQLARLWGHRLTWRVHEFLPVLEATWEASTRVRVVGGTLIRTSEMFQLLVEGADPRFVELLTARTHGEEAALAFRGFLFGRSSEELEQLTARMARESLSSIELDSRAADVARDAGSIYYEFFEARAAQSRARRQLVQPGPRRTAEGCEVLAWLEQLPE